MSERAEEKLKEKLFVFTDLKDNTFKILLRVNLIMWTDMHKQVKWITAIIKVYNEEVTPEVVYQKGRKR